MHGKGIRRDNFINVSAAPSSQDDAACSRLFAARCQESAPVIVLAKMFTMSLEETFNFGQRDYVRQVHDKE